MAETAVVEHPRKHENPSRGDLRSVFERPAARSLDRRSARAVPRLCRAAGLSRLIFSDRAVIGATHDRAGHRPMLDAPGA